MEPRGSGVSRAAASRAIALTLAGEDAVRAEGPETSFFPGELQLSLIHIFLSPADLGRYVGAEMTDLM